MGELLEELRSLQAVALKLVGIEQNLQSKLRRVSSRTKQVAQAEERLLQNKRLAQQIQIRIDQLSLEIASREESQANHRQALNKAKTNKEYASILAAMNTEKADTAKLEAAVLELMKEVENLTSQAATIDVEKAQANAEVDKAQKALDEYRKKCQPELTELEAKRAEFAEKIPPDALSLFDRAASRHEGEAMAEVSKAPGRGATYNCGGCNMSLTLEVVNALQSRDDVQKCDTCGRILYLEPQAASK